MPGRRHALSHRHLVVTPLAGEAKKKRGLRVRGAPESPHLLVCPSARRQRATGRPQVHPSDRNKKEDEKAKEEKVEKGGTDPRTLLGASTFCGKTGEGHAEKKTKRRKKRKKPPETLGTLAERTCFESSL